MLTSDVGRRGSQLRDKVSSINLEIDWLPSLSDISLRIQLPYGSTIDEYLQGFCDSLSPKSDILPCLLKRLASSDSPIKPSCSRRLS